MENPFLKKGGYTYDPRNPFNKIEPVKKEAKVITAPYTEGKVKVTNPFDNIQTTGNIQPVNAQSTLDTAKKVFSGQSISPSGSFQAIAPVLPVAKRDPFSSIALAQPKIAASTVAVPGVREIKMDTGDFIKSTVSQGIKAANEGLKPILSSKVYKEYVPFGPSETNILKSNIEQRLEPIQTKVLDKTLNTEFGKRLVTTVANSTEDSGLKALSAIEALSPSVTYQQAYEGWKKAKANPDNPMWKKALYGIQSALPQTAVGVALSFIPVAGQPLSIAYWSALSAADQVKEKGKVTSVGNIAIDTALDSVLGSSIETMFKAPTKSLAKTFAKTFTAEGGTEVTQTLLKNANNYRSAATPDERKAIVDETKRYITSGDILLEGIIGGLSGGIIGGAGYGIAKTSMVKPQGPTTEEPRLQFSGQELLQPTTQQPTAEPAQVLDFGNRPTTQPLSATVEQPITPTVADNFVSETIGRKNINESNELFIKDIITDNGIQLTEGQSVENVIKSNPQLVEPIKAKYEEAKNNANTLGEKILQLRKDGVKLFTEYEVTNRNVRTPETGNIAVSAVLPGQRKLYISPSILQRDIDALIKNNPNQIKALELDEHARTIGETDQELIDRYINSIVRYEKQHMLKGTVGEAADIEAGGEKAKETAIEMDRRAIKETIKEESEIDITGAEEVLAKKDTSQRVSKFLNKDGSINTQKTVEDFVVSNRAKKILDDLGIVAAEKYQGPRNLGVYKHAPNKARFRSLYDIITVSHEAAHGIDVKSGLIERMIKEKDPLMVKLKKAYLEYYPTANTSKRAIVQLREGYASFIENYFTNPDEMMEKYPELVQEIINPNGKYYDPKVTQLLESLNSLVEDFQKMTPEQKIGARLRDPKEVLKKDTGFTKAQKAVFNMFDYTEPFLRYAKENKIDINSYANPQLAHFNWLNRQAIAASWLDNKSKTNLIIDGKTGDVIRKDTGTIADYLKLIKGKEKEFDQYLIARRVVADNKKLTVLQDKLSILNNIIDDIKSLTEELTPAQEKKLKNLEANKTLLEERVKEQSDLIAADDFNVHEAKVVVDKYSNEFSEATSIHDNIWKNLNEFAYRNGLISEEQFNKWSSEEGYTSFKRFIDDDLMARQGGTTAAQPQKISIYKKRGGSTLLLMSPVNSQMKAIFEVIPKSLENTIWAKTAEMVKNSNSEQLKQRFEEVQVSDPRVALNDKNLVPVSVDGKTKFYEVGEEFREIRKIMSDKEIDTIKTIILLPSRIFTRATTSANPFFALGNITIDQFTRAYNTEYKTSTKDAAKALAKFVVASQDPKVQNFRMLGGHGQTKAGSQDIRDLSQEDLIAKVRGDKQGKFKKLITAVEVGVEVLEAPATVTEMATRYAEYKNALDRGATDTEARWAAANVTTNFGRHGAMFGQTGRLAVKAAPFLSPAIAGIYTFADKVKAHPGRSAFYAASTLALTVAMTTAMMMRADDEMKRKMMNLSVTELSKYIFIPMPKAFRQKTGVDFVKIKIPEIVGAIVGMGQLFTISHFTNNKATFKDYKEAATSWIPNQLNLLEPQKMILSWLPQIVKPSVQTIANFRDYPDVMPIVSDTMKNKPLEQQYNQNTSAFAKKIGPEIGISPLLVDYWIKAQFGATGKYATQGIGMPSVLMEADKYLTVGRVYQKFFDKKEESNIIKQRVEDSEVATDSERYEAKRDYLLNNKIGDSISDISELTKNDIEIPEKLKTDVNDLLNGIINDTVDTINAYNKLIDIDNQLTKIKLEQSGEMDAFAQLDIKKEQMSKNRAMALAAYEEAYRQFNPQLKKTNELDKATQNLLRDYKKNIKEYGGSDSDVDTIKENVSIEKDAEAEYKAKRKKLENIPEALRKENKELYQAAKEEKNALRKNTGK